MILTSILDAEKAILCRRAAVIVLRHELRRWVGTRTSCALRRWQKLAANDKDQGSRTTMAIIQRERRYSNVHSRKTLSDTLTR